jgi:structural maintenance of chromosome 4
MQEQGEKLREKASSSRHKAEEAKASQTANTSQNAVLDTLNRLKASGRIHGFHVRAFASVYLWRRINLFA